MTTLAPSTDLRDPAIAWARDHAGDFLAQLHDFLRIPSVSTQPDRTPDVWRAAEWLADNMRQAGLENCAVLPTIGHPIVYGDWLHAPGAPTVLFYGHYDVQPADEPELWKSPPFEPEIRNQNIYARGASDDKGQLLIMVKAVEALLQATGRLPVNVRFMIEGEEESGGEGIKGFIPQNRERLEADVVFVSDTSMFDFDTPSIVYGMRGIVSLNIDVTGPRLDLHSGTYGGAINNPINALAHILAALKDPDGHILIPGFYDRVRPIDAAERERLALGRTDEANWLEWTGAPALWGERQYHSTERTGARPTLDINGIVGGYTGDGAKTIIPSQAHAKITMRLVPHQDPGEIEQLFRDHVAAVTPPSVRSVVTSHGNAPASVVNMSDPAMYAAMLACEQVFERAPVLLRGGGSIPVISQVKADLGLETILLGFGLQRDRIHGPNERFYLPNFYRGIETVIQFLCNYSRGG